MYKFLVEVVFEQVFIRADEQGTKRRDVEITAQVYEFQDAKQAVALRDAQREFDNILRRGLKLKGGSILKNVIPPSAIKQIALVDYNLYQKEAEIEAQEQAQSEAIDSSNIENENSPQEN